jgi:urease accessory protein UreF
VETAHTILVRNATCSAASSVKPTWNLSCASNVRQATKSNALVAASNTTRQTKLANSRIPKNLFRAFFATEKTDGDGDLEQI